MTSVDSPSHSPKSSPFPDFPEVAIETQGLRKTFDGSNYILDGINLMIPKGGLTAIIGFSGTGKSVIIKHFMGLLRPNEGQIKVLNEDLLSMTPEKLTLFRRRLSVLFQGAALFDDMNVLENVCFPFVEHRSEWKEKVIVEKAKQILIQVGLDPKHFYKIPSQISGGMQKRTGLARALALDPEIIFYDEPTTGLDPILTQMVDNLILETHQKQNGKLTSVMVSHDLAAAFRIADYVVMLHKGKVILFGKPRDFLASEIEEVKEFVAKGIRHS